MKNHSVTLFIFSLSLFLMTCSIEPVSVGVWDLEIETREGLQASVWTIGPEATVSMSNLANINIDTETTAEEVVLDGSRISWSIEAPDLQDSAESVLRVNFNGSVNGNSLAGTIFTTLGNQTVRGVRR